MVNCQYLVCYNFIWSIPVYSSVLYFVIFCRPILYFAAFITRRNGVAKNAGLKNEGPSGRGRNAGPENAGPKGWMVGYAIKSLPYRHVQIFASTHVL